MNITVYLGAFPGNDPSFELAVKELGTWIGKSHNALIYGGSKSGLMGLIAESTLLAGGEVTGVEPQFFIATPSAVTIRLPDTRATGWLCPMWWSCTMIPVASSSTVTA